MNVVVNATPLIALALVGQLSLLREMFDAVIVPRAVYEEVVIDGYGQPGAAELTQASWVQVVSPARAVTLEPMLLGLDSGELSVLLLAQEIRPDWVIIDERLARRIAQAMGLPVKGTLGILLAAVWAGLLTRQTALDALEQLLSAGIRISPRWQHWFRSEVGEAAL
jgi:predicted nucleic acid-binding protein